MEPGEDATDAAEDEAARIQSRTGKAPPVETVFAMALAAQRALNRRAVRRNNTHAARRQRKHY